MIEAFANREALADAAALAVSERLSAPGGRVLAAAGGSTPGPIFDRLSRSDLSWAGVTVTLTDERWVDPSSDDSNENLVRRRLLVGDAAQATFLPLKGAGPTPEADAAAAEARLAALPALSLVLLGMGADGHVASLFPGTPELAAGLDPDGARLCLAVARPGLAPFVPRLTLTAHAILRAGLILLAVTGDEKRALIERIASDPDYAPPAATFLRQDRCQVRVLWAA